MKNFLFIICFGLMTSASFAQKVNTTLTYLVKEPGKKTPKTPVLIMLHGYGSNASDLFDMANTLDERFIVFSLQAPYSVNGSGFSWYTLDVIPGQDFKYNYAEAKESRAKILSFISNACKAYGLDSTQVFLMGFSQGAIMSYDISFHAPAKIKGVLALSGRLMAESADPKTDWLKVARVHFFIAHGQSDNVIKIAEAQKANDLLKSKKVTDLTYTTYAMPHSLNGKELNDIRRWLEKALGPKAEAGPKK